MKYKQIIYKKEAVSDRRHSLQKKLNTTLRGAQTRFAGMRPFYCTLWLFALTGTVLCSPSFEVTDNGIGTGFRVTLGSLLILEHTQESPMLYVGTGETNIYDVSGTYHVNNYVSSRVPLATYSFMCSVDSCEINLRQGSTNIVLELKSDKNQDLAISVKKKSGDFDRIWFRIAAEVDEEIHGGGEQYSYYNLRHRDRSGENVFPIWVDEQGLGRNKSERVTFFADTMGNGAGGDYYSTYFPQPTFVSSRNYYFHHDGYNYLVFDFSHDKFHEVNIIGNMSTIYFNKANTQSDLIQSLASFLGKLPTLPDWIQEGVILGVQGGSKTLKEKYQLARAHQIPVKGMWIQDWSGKIETPFGQRVNWNWQWNQDFYKDLNATIQNMYTDGVRVLGYINPNLVQNGNLFKEAESKGYLVKNGNDETYLRRSISFLFGQVDLTNPDAWTWYKNVIKTNMIGLGLGGWMADFGEYLAADAKLYDGRRGVDVHNEWPVLFAKLNREAVEEADKLEEVVFFTRSGFSGTSNYTLLMWNGDQNVDFELADGVRSTIYGTLNAGWSGVSLSHFDVGGYTTNSLVGVTRTQELLLRSAEYAVFTPVFRTHEGNEIANNVQWYSDAAIGDFAKVAKKFADLAEYRKHVVSEAASKGLPAVRPISMVLEGESAPPDQYMFGSDLLVAPVYEKNVTQRFVTFPPLSDGEEWVYIWNGSRYAPDVRIEFPAPLGEPPVFYRSDTTFRSVFEKLNSSSQGNTIEDMAFGV